MNFRALTVLSMLAASVAGSACSVLGEDTGTAESEATTVTPSGTSTLGTLEIQIPAEVAWQSGQRSLTIYYDPVANPGHGGDFSVEMTTTGGAVRVAPGTYCLTVMSTVGPNLNQLTTRDCSVEVPAGGKRTYRLGKVVFRAEDVAFLKSQVATLGGVSLLGPTDSYGNEGKLWLEPNVFAAAKSTLTTTVHAGSAGPWEPVTTEVPEGATVPLVLPSNDRVVRFKVGVQSGNLPNAFPGSVTFRLVHAPSYLSEYERTWNASPGDLTFFTSRDTKILFQVGGVERVYPMNTAQTMTVDARFLEVTDVEDTDDEGKVTKVRGFVSVRHVDGPQLKWGANQTSFSTGYGVLVWPGSYDVRVSYSSAGVYKTYEERVNVP